MRRRPTHWKALKAAMSAERAIRTRRSSSLRSEKRSSSRVRFTAPGKTESVPASHRSCARAGKGAIVMYRILALTQQTATLFKRGSAPVNLQDDWFAGVCIRNFNRRERMMNGTKFAGPASGMSSGSSDSRFSRRWNRLGIIIVDEETRATYKQDESRATTARVWPFMPDRWKASGGGGLGHRRSPVARNHFPCSKGKFNCSSYRETFVETENAGWCV